MLLSSIKIINDSIIKVNMKGFLRKTVLIKGSKCASFHTQLKRNQTYNTLMKTQKDFINCFVAKKSQLMWIQV